MQSDPPSLSLSLSASGELARLHKHHHRPVATSSLSLTQADSAPSSPPVRSRNTPRPDTSSNMSLSLGGSSEEDAAFDGDVDVDLGDTVDLASQADMPSLSLRAARATSNASSVPTTTVLPMATFTFAETDCIPSLRCANTCLLVSDSNSARRCSCSKSFGTMGWRNGGLARRVAQGTSRVAQ